MNDNKALSADPTKPPALLITPAEAAAIMRVSDRTVTRMCNDGTLKAVKVREQWRINREALLTTCGLK